MTAQELINILNKVSPQKEVYMQMDVRIGKPVRVFHTDFTDQVYLGDCRAFPDPELGEKEIK